MKKNLTKKLMLSVLTLAFAVVSLGASTFAWFTLSGSVKVEQISANVTGGFGLDVTVSKHGDATWKEDSATWYTGSLPASAFTDILEDVNLDAVTPSSKTIAADTVFNKLGSVKATEFNFIAFDLYFRITDPTAVSEELSLALTNLTLSSTSTSSWKADIVYKLANGKDAIIGENYNYNILSAARFAIVAADETYAFEQEVAATATDVSNTEGMSNNNGAVDYYNVKLNKSATEKLSAPNKDDVYETVKLSNFVFNGGEDKNNTYPLFTVKKYVPAKKDDEGSVTTPAVMSDKPFKATVYIWVEGWDAECINAIFNQELSIDMSYALVGADGKIRN